jgi:mono/diheme cytochrome c family protein
MKILDKKRYQFVFIILVTMFLVAACGNAMVYQPYKRPLESSQFFPNNSSARPVVPGTIPNNYDVENQWFYTGKTPDGQFVDGYPFPVTMDVLKRGQERYNIYCSPCHGFSGYGDGMIVQRGFSPPPSYHIDSLRQAPPGLFVNVITNGYGQMFSYAYRVEPADRWAIAAYIRALQLSQNASLDNVPATEQQKLKGTP